MLKMKRPEPIYTETGDASVREGEVDDRGGMQGTPLAVASLPPRGELPVTCQSSPVVGDARGGPFLPSASLNPATPSHSEVLLCDSD